MRYIIAAVALWTSVTCTALPWDTNGVHTKISHENANIIATKIDQTFKWLNETNENNKLLNKENLDKYFSEEVTYKVNKNIAAFNAESLLLRLQNMNNHLKSYTVKFPLNSMVINGDSAAVTYEIDIIRENGQHFHDLITTMIHFKNDKIDNWDAVIQHI